MYFTFMSHFRSHYFHVYFALISDFDLFCKMLVLWGFRTLQHMSMLVSRHFACISQEWDLAPLLRGTRTTVSDSPLRFLHPDVELRHIPGRGRGMVAKFCAVPLNLISGPESLNPISRRRGPSKEVWDVLKCIWVLFASNFIGNG